MDYSTYLVSWKDHFPCAFQNLCINSQHKEHGSTTRSIFIIHTEPGNVNFHASKIKLGMWLGGGGGGYIRPGQNLMFPETFLETFFDFMPNIYTL